MNYSDINTRIVSSLSFYIVQEGGGNLQKKEYRWTPKTEGLLKVVAPPESQRASYLTNCRSQRARQPAAFFRLKGQSEVAPARGVASSISIEGRVTCCTAHYGLMGSNE